MLKQLRNKKTAKKIWIVLAVIILPPFILWGSGSLVGDRQKKKSGTIGKIFGKKISSEQLEESMLATRNQAMIEFGEDFSSVQKKLDFVSMAWQRLILLSEAKRRGLAAGDKEVVDLIQSYPFLQRKGSFDDNFYNYVLQYVFHTQARAFEEQTRQNIILNKLYDQITKDVKVEEKELKKEYARVNEQISLYYIVAIPNNFSKDVSVTEKETQEYFRNNRLQFKRPLSFNLEYITIESEDKIREYIEQSNKKDAFAKLIKELELSIKETGLFPENGPIPEIGWAGGVMGQLTKAKESDYLNPVQVDNKFYIFRVKERKEPSVPEFDEIKNTVKETLIKNKTEEIAKSKIEASLAKARFDFKAKPQYVDFNKIAKLFGLKSDSTDLFKYGSYIEGIGASDDFWTKAKNLKPEEPSDIIALPSGFYIVKLKSRVPVEEKKFLEEKDDFMRQTTQQKKQEKFSKFTEELIKKSQQF